MTKSRKYKKLNLSPKRLVLTTVRSISRKVWRKSLKRMRLRLTKKSRQKLVRK